MATEATAVRDRYRAPAPVHRRHCRALSVSTIRNCDIITEPINLIPHKKFSEAGGRHNAVLYRGVDPNFTGSWTFHIFYVKRIWALLWDTLLSARVNT